VGSKQCQERGSHCERSGSSLDRRAERRAKKDVVFGGVVEVCYRRGPMGLRPKTGRTEPFTLSPESGRREFQDGLLRLALFSGRAEVGRADGGMDLSQPYLQFVDELAELALGERSGCGFLDLADER